MKKKQVKLIYVLLGTLTILSACQTTDNKTMEATATPVIEEETNTGELEEYIIEPAEVYVEDDAIIYNGELSEESVQMVKDLYTDGINRIILTSVGGEINLGIDFANFIYDNNLDVEIKDYAFSSAANYVSLAAKNLYLNPDSLIGFHGGASQDLSLYGELGEEEEAAIEEYLALTIANEDAFYEKIGVNKEITTIGQDERFNEKAQGHIGYTYTLEALKELGVDNIVLTENEWNVPTTFIDDQDATIFVIEKDELVE